MIMSVDLSYNPALVNLNISDTLTLLCCLFVYLSRLIVSCEVLSFQDLSCAQVVNAWSA